jgi:hypothetical protein
MVDDRLVNGAKDSVGNIGWTRNLQEMASGMHKQVPLLDSGVVHTHKNLSGSV